MFIGIAIGLILWTIIFACNLVTMEDRQNINVKMTVCWFVVFVAFFGAAGYLISLFF